jgi:hypothetical protein
MDFYVDVTPVSTPSSFYASQASAGRDPHRDHPYIGATRFLATGSSDVNIGKKDLNATVKPPSGTLKIDSTPLLSEGAEPAASRAAVHERPILGKEIEISKIAEDRIKLLAVKYANDSVSAEMIARLEILNSRLMERSPRVTLQQINFLESSIGSIKSVEQSRLDRAKRLGLAT